MTTGLTWDSTEDWWDNGNTGGSSSPYRQIPAKFFPTSDPAATAPFVLTPPVPALPGPSVEEQQLRSRIRLLEDERISHAESIRQLSEKVKTLEADKKRLEAELARRKPRLGDPRTVEE